METGVPKRKSKVKNAKIARQRRLRLLAAAYECIETYPNADQAVVTHAGIQIERSETIDLTEKEQENFKKIPFCYFQNDRGNFLIKLCNAANYWGIAY